jgi:hypothetical protein
MEAKVMANERGQGGNKGGNKGGNSGGKGSDKR